MATFFIIFWESTDQIYCSLNMCLCLVWRSEFGSSALPFVYATAAAAEASPLSDELHSFHYRLELQPLSHRQQQQQQEVLATATNDAACRLPNGKASCGLSHA